MSSVTAIKTMLERLGFSDAAAAYLTGTSGIDSLDEIMYLMSFICASVINHDITKVMGQY
jgi:hypothetical protein